MLNYPFLGEHGNKAAYHLDLSLSGAAQLAPFHEKVHFEALKQYSRNKLAQQNKLDYPIKFYLKLCHNISKEKNLDVDYGAVNVAALQYNIDSGGPDYLPLEERKQSQIKKPHSDIPVPRELDPIYEGFIMSGLMASGIFEDAPGYMLEMAQAILDLAESGYITAFLCGEVYKPDLAMLTLGVFTIIDKQICLRNEEGRPCQVSEEDAKKRAAKGIYDRAQELYKKAQS